MARYLINTEKVERLMLNRDMTVKALLTLAEMDKMTWWRIMRDARPTPLRNVTVLAYALGVDPKEIILKRIDPTKQKEDAVQKIQEH